MSEDNSRATGGEDRRRGQARCSLWHHYYTYGLRIRSQLPLPELSTCEFNGAGAEVEIRLGDVARQLENGRKLTPWLQVTKNCCTIDGGAIARYKVENGSVITIDRRNRDLSDSSADERDIRVYLLGTAFGALLHQRQWLPLHVSAVEIEGNALAFTGRSGAGKSTLAAWLHFRNGLRLVTDDIGVINPSEVQPMLHPGPPRLKLWDDAIENIGLDRHGLIQDLSRANKFHISKVDEKPAPAVPFRHLVILKNRNQSSDSVLRRLRGAEAYQAVLESIYRPGLNSVFYGKEQLHIHVANLTRNIVVHALERPWGFQFKDNLSDQLLRRLSKLESET